MSNQALPLTRRHLLRRAMGATFGASLLGGSREAPAAPTRSSLVVLVRQKDLLDASHKVNGPALRQVLTQALTRVTGQANIKAAWRSFLDVKDIVGLVPTDHLNKTHDELVELVQSTLVEAGLPADNIRIAQGSSNQVRACTALIALPALKAHWLTGIGTILKNYITFSGHPSDYHDADSAKLGEIWTMPHVKGKTRLVLVDALRPLCDKGPQADPRYLWDYNGLIAGRDPVAVETISVQVILKKREALRGTPWPLSPPPLCVEMADRTYGLGTSRLDEIRLERLGWTDGALV